ncbi:hypothetical protein BHE74_00033331 [Ensete ventricosum]|nr:hypothetical protein BHE74_00033331 [Ensete ventricosum]
MRIGIAGQCVHCIVGRLGLFLYDFFFRFKGFFKCFIVFILCWFNHEEPALFAVMFRLHSSSQFQHNSLADHSRSSSLVNFFGVGAWMAKEGAVGLGMAGRGATFVLRTSWFNCSTWIRMKEIVAIRVYGSSLPARYCQPLPQESLATISVLVSLLPLLPTTFFFLYQPIAIGVGCRLAAVAPSFAVVVAPVPLPSTSPSAFYYRLLQPLPPLLSFLTTVTIAM